MPNLYSYRKNTPNRITCSKIEEAPLPESREPNSHQDCFLKNRRGTAILLSRARLTIGLLSQKLKRHRSPNLESQTPNRIAFSKIKEAPLSESRKPDFQHDCFLKNRRGIVRQISRARYHIPLFQSALTKLKHVNLAAPTTLL
ncbi:hypothetical protein EV2_010941 [Malus domestica]